jgi:hypothetical protein
MMAEHDWPRKKRPNMIRQEEGAVIGQEVEDRLMVPSAA